MSYRTAPLYRYVLENYENFRKKKLLEQEVWQLEPAKRPTVDKVVQVLESVREQVNRNIVPEEIRVIRPISKVPVILTEISALPTLTIYRTLEEQRRQAEEDEKWLAEQEDFVWFHISYF